MRDTTVTVQRNGSTVAIGVLVQVDQASDEIVLKHQQLYGFETRILWKIYTVGWPIDAAAPHQGLIHQGDVLLDERYVDPQSATSAKYRYTVYARPKDFQYDHQEISARTPDGD